MGKREMFLQGTELEPELNEHILNLLKAAPEYMHKKSRLYLPVHTLTDYNETLKYVLTNYKAKLVAVGQLRTKQFVEDNLDYYLKLNEEGIIQIFLNNGKWYSNGAFCAVPHI